MTSDFSVVGKRLPRLDAVAKVKGEAIHVSDIQLPGMLYTKFLRSPHPHARIARIDTREAESLSGVDVVLTHRNIPKVHPRNKFEYLLDETVHHAGEEVAVVAAATREIAEQALKLIEVEYEVLPAVFDAEEAMLPEAPLVHPEHGSNVYHGSRGCTPDGWLVLEVGDVNKGFAEADYIVDGTYETPIQHPCSPVPRSVVCQWSGDKLTCWVDTQAPLIVWRDLSRGLGIPQSDIRLIVCPVGGYGCKEPEKTAIITALLARMTSRPVKAAFTREEDFIATHRRLNYKIYARIGVKQDGSITAIHNRAVTNFGADSQVPHYILATSATRTCSMLYQWQNSKFEGCSVMTNTPHHAAMIGFGDPEAAFCVERLIDEAAEKTGMDPAEFRLKNCLRYGATAYDRERLVMGTSPVASGIAGPDINSLQQCIQMVAEKAGWKKKWQGWTTPVEICGIKRRGIGIAIGMHHCSYLPYSAVVKMNNDGTATVLTGAVDMGQGCTTAMAQVVAEALGIYYEDVNVITADTAVTPAGYGNTGSMGTSSAIAAAKYAADDARHKMFEIAARELDAKPGDLNIKNRKIFISSHHEKEIPVARVCQTGFQVMGFGINPPPDSIRDEKTGEAIRGYAVAAVIAEVEVDTDTGELNVTQITTSNDCGTAINPTMVENQIDLGITIGNGWARSENLIIDKSTGVVLNPNLLDYKIMTILDIPKRENTNSSYIEMPSAWGPYGAKGFSETAMVAVAPAIANAIYNAIGVRLRGEQFTPDRILKALGKA